MDNDVATVENLLRQQAALAKFGTFALRESDLNKILTEAARVCATGLSVPFSKVCRYRDAEGDLLVEAGYGWKAGVVGHAISCADDTTPQGRAFITGEPLICNDLRADNDLELPAFYAEHGIVSTVDVIIRGDTKPYGVLEIDSDTQHDYDEHDINFLTGFANVLAEAVSTSTRLKILHTTVAQMEILVEEKNRLLDQKKVLAEELQHRVRNNLQLISGMLTRQLGDTTDEAGHRGIKAIARRVTTLAQVYDQLLGSELKRTTDFGGYVKSLCLSLEEIQADSAITLNCDSETVILDLDVVTALGIVLAELVTNSYEHGFPSGTGAITVSVRPNNSDDHTATMIVRDNGKGSEPGAGNKRHGVGLVRRLIEQVHGIATVKSDSGTVWSIRFPMEKLGQAAA